MIARQRLQERDCFLPIFGYASVPNGVA
jgi:hypothetical protein